MDQVSIRFAQETDLAVLLEIYQPYVEETAISFEFAVPTLSEFKKRYVSVSAVFPYLVAEYNGKLVGYAYASAFKQRQAYSWDAESSIYVDRNYQHSGIGSKLYDRLESILTKQGIVNLFACVSCQALNLTVNASIRFHQQRGYQLVGLFRQCGYKFEQWHDIAYLVKCLNQPIQNQPSVLPVTCFRKETD
ncbi:MAG: N-acetyltransferase family protein [Erysipelotrichaceae bacterium]|nr:N-acetyltransferase family protein [Erysipelotrichaceae bacterium]